VNDYLEIKRHKNKPDQQFHCELLHLEPGYAVLLYASEKSGLIADIHIPAGSTTIAHYWQEKPYVIWRMFDCNKSLIGTLFHICTNVCIQEERLSYDDLLIDIWISPDDLVRVLDKNELQTCIEAGLISTTEKVLIRQAQKKITTRHAEIIFGLTAFDCTP